MPVELGLADPRKSRGEVGGEPYEQPPLQAFDHREGQRPNECVQREEGRQDSREHEERLDVNPLLSPKAMLLTSASAARGQQAPADRSPLNNRGGSRDRHAPAVPGRGSVETAWDGRDRIRRVTRRRDREAVLTAREAPGVRGPAPEDPAERRARSGRFRRLTEQGRGSPRRPTVVSPDSRVPAPARDRRCDGTRVRKETRPPADKLTARDAHPGVMYRVANADPNEFRPHAAALTTRRSRSRRSRSGSELPPVRLAPPDGWYQVGSKPQSTARWCRAVSSVRPSSRARARSGAAGVSCRVSISGNKIQGRIRKSFRFQDYGGVV